MWQAWSARRKTKIRAVSFGSVVVERLSPHWSTVESSRLHLKKGSLSLSLFLPPCFFPLSFISFFSLTFFFRAGSDTTATTATAKSQIRNFGRWWGRSAKYSLYVQEKGSSLRIYFFFNKREIPCSCFLLPKHPDRYSFSFFLPK